jgi:hypothetical protein
MAIAQGLALSRQRRIHRRHFRSAVSPSSAGSPTNPEHHHGHHHGHQHAQHGHTEVHESQATTVQVEVAVEKPTVMEPVDSVWGPSPVAVVQPSVPASTAAAVPASADPSGTGSGGHGSSTGTGTGGSGAGVGAPLEVDLGSASNAEACRCAEGCVVRWHCPKVRLTVRGGVDVAHETLCCDGCPRVYAWGGGADGPW